MDAIEIESAKRIAHLFKLTQLPNPPRRNPLTDTPIPEERYTLPLTWERWLTRVFAFLSSVTGKPKQVTAVCIKENWEAPMDVLLAINKNNPDDGDSVLQEVQKGFANLFNLLSHKGSPESANNGDRVFDAILLMCHKRILRRLKLRGAKPSIKKTLERGREAIREAGKTSEFSPLVEEFGKLESVVDAWLATDKTARSDKAPRKLLKLKAIVLALCDLQQRQDLITMVGKIPNSADFSPNSKTSLLNIIKKVAVYWKCVPFLRRLETKYFVRWNRSLFGQMKVVLAKLPPQAFTRAPADHLKANFASKIPEEFLVKDRAEISRRRCRGMRNKHGQLTRDANGDQARLASETLTKGKVHAEIQLLFHCYELEEMELPPRVVSSSKDACYLCDAFISMHGRMHVPGSHGRLYHAWRLPKVGDGGLHSRFVNSLDVRIREEMVMRQRDGPDVRNESPNESPNENPNESTTVSLPSTLSPVDSGSSDMTSLIDDEEY